MGVDTPIATSGDQIKVPKPLPKPPSAPSILSAQTQNPKPLPTPPRSPSKPASMSGRKITKTEIQEGFTELGSQIQDGGKVLTENLGVFASKAETELGKNFNTLRKGVSGKMKTAKLTKPASFSV